MAQIEPDSDIWILHNIPLDNTYHDTIYWDSETAQTDYFTGKVAHKFTKNSYQRSNKGTLKIGIKADSLYDCDYLMFRNTGFGTKWFYAFINEVNYINNQTCEVVYEMDVIQTWFFHFKTDYCFIEREHTATDVVGEHIEPEPVALGEYVYNDYTSLMNFSYCYTIVGIVDVSNDGAVSADGKMYDGIYGGTTLYLFNTFDTSGINSLLNNYTDSPDSIVCMYQIPASICSIAPSTGGTVLSDSFSSNRGQISTGSTAIGSLNGYTPKNNKLYTYPYNFYCVDNGNGQSMALRYEFFSGGSPILYFTGTVTQPVSVIVKPYNYKGTGTVTNTESLSFTNFPLCSWNMDTYKAWVAQNSTIINMKQATNIVQSFVGGAGNAVGAMAYGNVAGAKAGFLGSLFGGFSNAIGIASQAMQDEYTASISADISKGTLNSGIAANMNSSLNNLFGGRMSVTSVMAKSIDNFFTMFGYAVRVMGSPNRNVRPHFTYCKTIGNTVHGSIPNEALRQIGAIYDNGICWWKNPDEVGDYYLDNAPA